MPEYVDVEKAFCALQAAIENKDTDNIPNCYVKAIFETDSLLGIVINYVALSQTLDISVSFGCDVLPAGTKLFRIRRYVEGVDFSRPEEWGPPPHRKQNRANREGEQALYLASNEDVCILETHIKPGEKYVIAEYICRKNISLGGFFCSKRDDKRVQMIAMILNAFLSAPARGDYNKRFFEYLDIVFPNTTKQHLKLNALLQTPHKLPYLFATLNKRHEYYNMTNEICDVIKKEYHSGIRYGSSYIPIDGGIAKASHYNVVLYETGIKKISFQNCAIKTRIDNGLDECAFAKLTLNES